MTIRGSLSHTILLLVILFHPGAARSATLHFQAVPTAVTSICAAPCFNLLMFYEDETRELELRALQMGLHVSGATVAELVTPPATNGNAVGGNVYRGDEDGNIISTPWDLSSTIGVPTFFPRPDVLTVNAASIAFDINSLQARNAAYSSFCMPSGTCAIQDAALAENRVFIARFNIRAPTAAVFVRVEGIEGLGEGIFDPLLGIERLEGSSFAVEFVPEPGPLLLMAVLGAAVAWLRRRPAALPCLLLAGSVIVAAGPASSAPIRWQFDSFVRSAATDPVDPGVSLGNRVQGSLDFDPQLAEPVECSATACIYSLPARLVATTGTHVLQAQTTALLRLSLAQTSFEFADRFTYDDQPPPAGSALSFVAYAPPPVPIDSLPAAHLPIPELDGNFDVLELLFGPPDGKRSGFTATLLSVTEAPEPAAPLLLLAGLIGVFLRVRP